MDRKNLKKYQYFYIGIFILFLMIPCLLFIVIGEDSAVGSLLKKSVYFLISLSIITIPLTFLKPKYYSYLTILLFPLVIFEASHILQFKTASSQELIASILLTNFNEIKETVLLNFFSVIVLILIFLLLLNSGSFLPSES